MAHLPSFDKFFKQKNIESNWFLKFRNDRMKRDIISCGLAAGVSAGFLSPIGGIMFVIEEFQTFWSLQMTISAFICSLFAGFVMSTCLSLQEGESEI